MATNRDNMEQHSNEANNNNTLCDLCTENLAEVNCTQCEQYYCSGCLNRFHRKNRATKEHQVIPLSRNQNNSEERYRGGIGERSETFNPIRISTTDVQKCKFHASKDLVHFCKTHETVTCDTCNLLDHRNCRFISIHDITTQTSFKKEAQDVLTRGEDLLDKFKNLDARYASHHDKMTQQKEALVKEMGERCSKQEKEVSTKLNNLEMCFNKLVTDEINNLKTKNAEISRMKEAIKQQENDYKKLLKMGSAVQKRVMTMLLEEDIRKYCEALDDIRQNCFTISTDDVLDKVNKFDSKLQLSGVSISKIPNPKALKDRDGHYFGEISIDPPSGKSKIVGLEVMSDNKILICDQTQQIIVLIDIDYKDLTVKRLSSVILFSAPYSMAVMNDTTVFVSLPNEKLIQKIERTDKNLVLTASIPEEYESAHAYIRLLKYDQNLLAYERTDFGSIINEINQDGEVIRLITKDPERRIQSVGFMSVSPKLDTVYITEKTHGCLGLSMTGDLVFKYKANDAQYYQGIYIDDEGYIYLAEQDSNKIVVLTNKGEKEKDLITMKDMQPNCLTFDRNHNKLLVVKGKSGKILVFDMQ